MEKLTKKELFSYAIFTIIIVLMAIIGVVEENKKEYYIKQYRELQNEKNELIQHINKLEKEGENKNV